MKLAVYGTLKKGLHNHHYLQKSKYIGEFETLPIYNFFSVRDSFPAVTKGGYRSVLMEVYDVTHEILDAIDGLEGYKKFKEEDSLYVRKEIDTPYGVCFTYFYNKNTKHLAPIVDSHDWKEFISIKQIYKSL